MQQPYGADKQKLKIVEKGGFLSFDFMPDKLSNPGKQKNEEANLPHLGPAVIIVKFLKPDNAGTEDHNNEQHRIGKYRGKLIVVVD